MINPEFKPDIPEMLPQLDPNASVTDTSAIPGDQFLYTPNALGLSSESQDKLAELVDGRGLSRAGGGRRLKWPTVASLVRDLHQSRAHDTLVGPNVADELRRTLQSD